MHLLVQILFFAFFALTALAQVPSYTGPVLLQPGLTNASVIDKCAVPASNAIGALVTIQPCNSTSSSTRKWTFTGGKVQIFGDKCLDVHTDGQRTQISICSDDKPNQKWSYDKWRKVLSLGNETKCLDLANGKLDDGTSVLAFKCQGSENQVWNTGYLPNELPQTSQDGQFGINNCNTASNGSSNCQTAWISSAQDFCLFGPPVNATIGESERTAVAYCTKSVRGARLFPNTTLRGVHFVTTPEYVQVTGVGDFTKINIPAGDSGGELDNRGADGNGNPIGGLVFRDRSGTVQQSHEWTTFISDKEFCFRACFGRNSTRLCNHVYDIMGCYWNIPANYEPDKFEDCVGDPAEPMGVYNGTSTWSQGVTPTPSPHPAPSSSQCQIYTTITVA